MNALIPVPLIAAGVLFSLASSLAPSPAVAPMKCGVTDLEPLIALDGAIADVKAEDIDREEISWLEIVCMDPVDSTFSMDPGIPVVSIWTRDGPAPHMLPLLTRVLEFQTDHHRRHGEYADELVGLDDSEFPSEIEVSLQVANEGWLAVASIYNLLGRCVVFDGQWPRPHADVEAGIPRCVSRHDVARARF